MSKPDKVVKSRFGGIAVLVVAAVTAVAAVVVGLRWRSNHGAPDVTQPMELGGRWLGMRLTGVGSPTARRLGIPASVQGVVVAELSRGLDSRGLQAGLVPGDVLTRVDGKTVKSLEDLYSLTLDLNVARPLVVEILRRGQPLAVLLPAPAQGPLQRTGTTAGQRATQWKTTTAAWP